MTLIAICIVSCLILLLLLDVPSFIADPVQRLMARYRGHDRLPAVVVPSQHPSGFEIVYIECDEENYDLENEEECDGVRISWRE